MREITRRGLLGASAAIAGAGLLRSRSAEAEPEWHGPPPEPGAQLRVLRWKQFI